MYKKPPNLIYGVDEKPPIFENIILGLQHVSIFFISIVIPVLLVAYMGDAIDERTAQGFISFSMISAGVITILQSFKKSPVGSGYLIPSVCGPSYLHASMMAVASGGLPLLFGMTGFVGVVEMLFSRFMHRLRFLFPTEVTGVVVLLVGIEVIPLSMKSFIGLGAHDDVTTHLEILTGVLTLAVMLGLNVFSKGKLRLYSVLIGIIFGYLISAAFGLFTDTSLNKFSETSLFALPVIKGFGWRFDISLMIPFIIAALSSTLKTVGDITTAQKINNANWKRMELKSVSGGILADGFGGLLPGLIGGFGQSTSSANIGLSMATGATSRVIAWSTGVLLVLLAFFPKISEFFLLMPLPVIGATLLYAVSFMIMAGFQIIMSRMLDARKTFIVGISIITGISVFVLGDRYTQVHAWFTPIFSSALSLGTVTAIVLNLILRIGTKKHVVLDLALKDAGSNEIFEFMEYNGKRWGARPEVIFNVSAALNEFVELAAGSGLVSDDHLKISVSFNELNINVVICYQGEAIQIPEKRPQPEELLSDENAYLNLAGFLIRKYAQKITTTTKHSEQHLKLHFDH